MVLKSIHRWLILIICFGLLTCTDVDGIKRKEDSKRKNDFLFLLLAQNRTKGNCLRKDSSTGINSCDRRSGGICSANDLILTSSERTLNLRDGNNLVEAVPSCNFSFLNSGIPSEVVATYSDEDTIKANNTYFVVDSCEATAITSTASLITELEFLYLNSSKGRIGVSADKIYNTSDFILLLSLGNLKSVKQVKSDALACLTDGFPQSEKDLFSDIRTVKKTKALTCSVRTGATNNCP